MVDINKEMTWEEVKSQYGGETLFLKILERDRDPIRVYVYGMIEDVKDKALVRSRIQNGESGCRLYVPKDSDVFGKTDIFEVRIL